MLPIGSIVYLREGTSKTMILNRAPILPSEETEVEGIWYDYSGCFYPQGLNPNNVYYFNEENIDEVVFEGFKGEEEERFIKIFKDWQEESNPKLKKRNSYWSVRIKEIEWLSKKHIWMICFFCLVYSCG